MNRGRRSSHRFGLLLAVLLPIAGMSCTENAANERAKRQILKGEKSTSIHAVRAQEVLDSARLADDRTILERVVNMRFGEVVERLGPVRYEGTAKIVMNRGRETARIEETSTIVQGKEGDFRVWQTDGAGVPLREAIHHHGLLYVRDAGGKLRGQGIVNDQHLTLRDEAFQPLATFLGYFKARAGVKFEAETQFQGRAAYRYGLRIRPGQKLIADDKDLPKQPVMLKGSLVVDKETATVLRADLTGELLVPIPGSDAVPGKISIELQSVVTKVEPKWFPPSDFVEEIRARPSDIDPLAFMKGDTRTSTVIGGQRDRAEQPSK